MKPRIPGEEPGYRVGHTAVNIGENRILVYGGFSYESSRLEVFSDLHKLDLETMTWQRLEAKGVIPPARFSHVSFALSPTIVVIFGGTDGFGAINTTHLYDGMLLCMIVR